MTARRRATEEVAAASRVLVVGIGGGGDVVGALAATVGRGLGDADFAALLEAYEGYAGRHVDAQASANAPTA